MCNLCQKYGYCDQCSKENPGGNFPATQKQIDYLYGALQHRDQEMFFDLDALFCSHNRPNSDYEPGRGISSLTRSQAHFCIMWLTGSNYPDLTGLDKCPRQGHKL